MSKYKYVLFDFDGTVADTGEGILRSLQYAFREMGDEVPSLKELECFIGPPVYYSFTEFYGISPERVSQYIKKYRERYKRQGIYESCLYDGVASLLQTLRAMGVRTGVASSKPEHLIIDVGDYLKVTELFDTIVGVKTDDSKHSSKKGIIEECMKNLGVTDKSQVLMVGDRHFDIDGAALAGVDSCGCLWGFGSEKEFSEHNATYIVKAPDEIIKIIEKME